MRRNAPAIVATIVALAACGSPTDPRQSDSGSASSTADHIDSVAKNYFVYGCLQNEGGVKVVDADGSRETLLASGGDILEPDGIEADLENGRIYWTDMGVGDAARKLREHKQRQDRSRQPG